MLSEREEHQKNSQAEKLKKLCLVNVIYVHRKKNVNFLIKKN